MRGQENADITLRAPYHPYLKFIDMFEEIFEGRYLVNGYPCVLRAISTCVRISMWRGNDDVFSSPFCCLLQETEVNNGSHVDMIS